MVRSLSWIYDHLVCEFYHWDICVTGLVQWKGEKWFCKLRDKEDEYVLRKVAWNDECEDYLEDYRVCYKHWCYKNGKRCNGCGIGYDMSWFHEKWQDRNPIEERSK